MIGRKCSVFIGTFGTGMHIGEWFRTINHWFQKHNYFEIVSRIWGWLVMTCEEYLSNMKPGYTVDGGSEEHLVMHELRHCLLFILFSFLLQHWQQGQVQESIC